MYKSPNYWRLKATITHWQKIQYHTDLARKFRTMVYDEQLTLTSSSISTVEGLEVVLTDSLRAAALRFLAEQCEEVAVKIAATPPEAFDIREACKV